MIIRMIEGNQYGAGEDGNVYCYSHARCNAKRPYPFILSSFIWGDGYPTVSVILAGKRKSRSVHTLVCTAWHGEKPSPVHEVRHLNGDKFNSRPINLAWGTPAENEADKRRHGRTARRESHGAAKLTEEAIAILRASIPEGLWNPVDAARVFGVDPSAIRAVVAGKTWKDEAISFKRVNA